MTIKKFRIPIYRDVVGFTKARADFAKTFPTEASTDARGLCGRGGAGVLLGVFDNSLSTLMHESIHAAFYVLDRSGVLVSADNDEALAYLAEFIFDKCHKIMRTECQQKD